MGAPVAAVIVAKERRVVETFTLAGATSPAAARSLDVLGMDAGGIGMRRLRERAVIREAGPGLYYLDVEVWQAVRRTRHRIAFIILVVVIAMGLMLAVIGQARASRQSAVPAPDSPRPPSLPVIPSSRGLS